MNFTTLKTEIKKIIATAKIKSLDLINGDDYLYDDEQRAVAYYFLGDGNIKTEQEKELIDNDVKLTETIDGIEIKRNKNIWFNCMYEFLSYLSINIFKGWTFSTPSFYKYNDKESFIFTNKTIEIHTMMYDKTAEYNLDVVLYTQNRNSNKLYNFDDDYCYTLLLNTFNQIKLMIKLNK